ncbi:MAG: nitroreductase family protein [Methanosphaera sp.]|uniref:nitroreductase family protein n=1 Tax=Methanosphaera sp. TaxID=2666342 RepID=UPI0025FB12EE|nr:nitroreductase family protein [Methanosphaera sp.]MCI5867342.1 nitroreductase family protein [Methanosphaera sp.]MDD6534590.1 nitroreductase family protein [Methanosphaera sp.]MDY3955742.1 nitroreductase family protein [Methanosphaera sp.]
MILDINPIRCVRCGLCESVCIFDNISLEGDVHEVGNDCFKCGHCVAICPTGAINLKEYEDYDTIKTKYKTDSLPVNYDDFLEVLNRRRSMRWFRKQKIEKQTYEKLFECVYNSPTATNAQDLEFVVVSERIDEFNDMLYDILKDHTDIHPRVVEFIKYMENNKEGKNPMLWDGREVILGFSTNATTTCVAAARIEIMAQIMGLGGFYNKFIVLADEFDHEKVMSFFPDIDSDKHLHSAFIIGYPKKKFKRPLPKREVKISYE